MNTGFPHGSVGLAFVPGEVITDSLNKSHKQWLSKAFPGLWPLSRVSEGMACVPEGAPRPFTLRWFSFVSLLLWSTEGADITKC